MMVVALLIILQLQIGALIGAIENMWIGSILVTYGFVFIIKK